MRKQSSVMRASNVDSVLSAVRTDEMDSLDSCFKAGVVVDRKDSCSDCARGYPAPCCRPLFAAEAGFHLGFTLIFMPIETCVALLLSCRHVSRAFHVFIRGPRFLPPGTAVIP